MSLRPDKEVKHELSAQQAREVTDKIRAGLEGVYQLIIEAYRGRVWTALGYGSWDEYVQREFGNQSLRPPLEERTEVVRSLRESGLSIRAIAAATQVSKGTVQNELTKSSGVQNWTPEQLSTTEEESGQRSSIIGQDGKDYKSQSEPPNKIQEAHELYGQGRSISEIASATGLSRGAVHNALHNETSSVNDESHSLDAVLDAPAQEVGVQLIDPEAVNQRRTSHAEKILKEFHGDEVAVLHKTLFLAEKVGSLVSPVSGAMNVDQSAYSHVTKDIASAVRQFAYIAKTLAGAEMSFQNDQLREQVIEDLQFAHEYLVSTVSEMRERIN
jgi:predicted DNA-binding protein YlxM (UPF0122 family)